jgi:hypothetical protein
MRNETRPSLLGTVFCAAMAGLILANDAVAGSAERARKFAALPNWTGIWQNVAWLADASGRPPGGEAEIRANSNMVGEPPYNEEWGGRYRQAMRDTAALTAKMAGLKGCTRVYPGLLEGPYTFQIATLPEETLFVFNNGQVRHVYTDGRAHPRGDDLWPTALGDSIGRWDGEVLIIDTIARDSGTPIMPRAWATMLSDQAHFVERVRRLGADTLEDQMTIEDPVAFVKPWTFTIRYQRLKADRLVAYDCDENDRNPATPAGGFGIAPAK